jgi:hypothetical protein
MQNRIFYHARKPSETVICEHCGKNTSVYKGLNNPIFTVGIEFDEEKRIVYVAWAKPNNGESYVKSFGIQTVNNRLNRIIERYPNITYGNKIPKIVHNYIDFYLKKAMKYFKIESNDRNIIYHI